MTSLLDVPRGGLPLGSERPRVWTFPPAAGSSGDEIADFVAVHGLVLDPWQRLALRCAMGERADGRWAAGQVAIIVPRQNGKGKIVEARELGGLFLLGEHLITHTAHQFKTASDAFTRVRAIIDASDDLTRRVKRILTSPVDKSIELVGGSKLSFIARSGGSGRGFSGDVVILDEAYDLSQDEMDALIPTLTTAPDPQVWYTSSAGKAHSAVLANIRRQGIAGSPTLAYMEWSVQEPADGAVLDPDDPVLLAQANPGYPVRVGADYLAIERSALSLQGRLRERLGIFDEVAGAGTAVDAGLWAECLDVEPQAAPVAAFGVEVDVDRAFAAIGLAARRADGSIQVECDGHARGVGWVVARCAELTARRPGVPFVVDGGGPAASLIGELEAAGVTVLTAGMRDVARSYGLFVDAVRGRTLRHGPQVELDAAVGSARTRPCGDGGWAFGRKASGADITPLTAASLAHWAAVTQVLDVEDSVW